MKRKIIDTIENKGEIINGNDETDEDKLKQEAERNQKEFDEKMKSIKTLRRTLRNNGKPVDEEKIVKRQQKLTPLLIMIYTFIFIFSGLSLIIKVYGVVKN